MSTSTAGPRSRRVVSEFAIEAYHLRKTYRNRRGQHVAVANLDLKVPNGGVHGFLGPNGSGKTTTIRMLLGLIRADSGFIRLFDTEVPQALPQVIDRIGAIVEQPKFFPAFSGRKNLQLLAQAIGAPRARVDQVLEEVGLGERGKDRFKGYSLGMKQRLAVAGTLLKDPDLLIFDEPTNGLDPAGIREIRATMRGLADRGKTVLVSSHILSEVQLVADTVTIIGRGQLLAEGNVNEILRAEGEESVQLRVADQTAGADILARAGFAVSPLPDGRLDVRPGRPGAALEPEQVSRVLAQQGHYVSELVRVRPDLESVFLQLTATDQLGGASAAPTTFSAVSPAPLAPLPPATLPPVSYSPAPVVPELIPAAAASPATPIAAIPQGSRSAGFSDEPVRRPSRAAEPPPPDEEDDDQPRGRRAAPGAWL